MNLTRNRTRLHRLNPENNLTRKGSVLVFVMAVLLLTGVLAVSVITIGITATESGAMATPTAQARFLADSGVDFARLRFCAGNGVWDGPYTLALISGDSVTFDLTPDATRFVAVSTINPGNRMESRAEATRPVPDCGDNNGNGDSTPEGASPDDYVLYAGGANLTVPSGATIDGSVYAESVSIASSSTEITGNVISETSVTLGSGTTVGGFVCAAAGDVHLRSSSTIVAGDVYAFGDVILGSGTAVLGSVFATGSVHLQSSDALIGGEVHAGVDFTSAKGEIGGGVFAGWNIAIRNQTAIGSDAHAGNNLTFGPGGANSINGASYAAGNRNDHEPTSVFQSVPPRIPPTAPDGCPPPPPPPRMQTFTPGNHDLSVPQGGNVSVEPGVYGNLDIGGGATVTLKAGNCSDVGESGCYVFRSFGPARWGQRLRLDLSTGERITVFTTGDVGFSGPVEISTDGINYTRISNLPDDEARALARRVYWENHGNFQITTINVIREWFGTVLSRNNISIASDYYGVGAIASVEGHVTLHPANPTILFIIADFAREHWMPHD